MRERNIYLMTVMIAFILLGLTVFHAQFRITHKQLGDRIIAIIRNYNAEDYLTVDSNRLEQGAKIEIVDYKQTNLVTAFSGFISTEDRPAKFIITFKKHPILNLYRYDKLLIENDYHDYIVLSTSYGLLHYDCTIFKGSFAIDIDQSMNLSIVLITLLVGFIIITKFRALLI